MAAEGSSSHSALLDATAVATVTSAPDTMPPIFNDNMDLYAQDIFFPQPVSTPPQLVVILSNDLSCYALGPSHL